MVASLWYGHSTALCQKGKPKQNEFISQLNTSFLVSMEAKTMLRIGEKRENTTCRDVLEVGDLEQSGHMTYYNDYLQANIFRKMQ